MSAIFGESLNFGQENGPDVRLITYGDEHYARYEDLNGYTVIYDSDLGVFCYARLEGNRFASTGVGLDQAPPQELVRHLRESDAVRIAKMEQRELIKSESLPRGMSHSHEIVRTFGPNQGLLAGRQLSSGAVRGLTILVRFQDVSSTASAADVDEMLNGANFTRNDNISSVREYFRTVSNNRLDYTNVVVGPYQLSHNREHYVNNLLVEEALTLAVADGLDLAQFDSRNEGIVDALNILYAGQSQYRGDLWPHNFSIHLRHGGIRTDLYLLTGLGRTASELSIGTFCHENGHLLCRFPDMYDYGSRDGDSEKSAGIGRYCLMGSGNHLDAGRSPSPVCAYLRDLAGWVDNVTELSAAGDYQAPHGAYDSMLRYPTSSANEYFLIENRSQQGLDRALPSSGLAVYHCDIFGSNEFQEGTAARHYQCALLQADGRRDLERNANPGDPEDLFASLAGLALSADSNPHTREWNGRDSGLMVSNISAPGDVMTFSAGEQTSTDAATGEAEPMSQIPDNSQAGVLSPIDIAASGIVGRIQVSLDIEHTWIGDLTLELFSPNGARSVLHRRSGGSSDNLVRTYDSDTPGELASLVGQPMQGRWVLWVSDSAWRDQGMLRKWSIELTPSTSSAAPPLLTRAGVAG